MSEIKIEGFESYFRDATRFLDLYDGPLEYVVDIGAHVGSLALLAAQKGATRVMACEPNPHTFKVLTRLIKENKFGSVIKPVEKAVIGNRDEWRVLHSPHESLERANGITSLIDRWPMMGCTMRVKCKCFKSVLKETIDYLKVDIEGAEYELFDGLTKEDLKNVRFLDLEVHHTPDCDEGAFHKRIKELGFTKDAFPEVLETHGINAIGRYNDNFKEEEKDGRGQNKAK